MSATYFTQTSTLTSVLLACIAVSSSSALRPSLLEAESGGLKIASGEHGTSVGAAAQLKPDVKTGDACDASACFALCECKTLEMSNFTAGSRYCVLEGDALVGCAVMTPGRVQMHTDAICAKTRTTAFNIAQKIAEDAYEQQRFISLDFKFASVTGIAAAIAKKIFKKLGASRQFLLMCLGFDDTVIAFARLPLLFVFALITFLLYCFASFSKPFKQFCMEGLWGV
eukprot:TRINITY_DN28216_c0_g1_i1.p1 TRINITY_DN28216_c0_g1~~TRINITY_DN28216_c0_g1_i1.p1  ORF type:complete len:226 (+),score=35.33 TRINITY_DN28216_c0_g1_i1:43-720(+)